MREGESKTRRRIVKLLKTEGAMDSASLAGRLKVTPMAVRQHLYALQQEKLVSAEERPVPLGRPAKHWRDKALNSHSAMLSQLPCFGV